MIIKLLIMLVAVFLAMYHLIYTQTLLQPALLQQNTHLTLSLVLVFLARIAKTDSRMLRMIFIVLILISLLSGIYILYNADALYLKVGFPDTVDIYVGVLLILVVIIATIYEWGIIISTLTIISVIYFFIGHHLPGVLGHSGFVFGEIISYLSIGLFGGLFGTFMNISANFIFLFMLFGGLLTTLDAGRFFEQIGLLVGLKVKGGSGQATVIGSGLVGSMTGMAVANVAITGSYTLKLMEKSGYSKESAGAIEATASTGGQIFPPVMGAAAFIMAGLISMNYIEIAAMAIIPSILYIITVMAGVRGIAYYEKIKDISISAIEPKVIILYFPLFIIPLSILTYLLLQRYSVMYSVFFTIVSLVSTKLAMIFLRYLLPHKLWDAMPSCGNLGLDLKDYFKRLLEGTRDGSLMGARLAVVIGSIGILAQTITSTGAAPKIAAALEPITSISPIIALSVAALISVLLGVGLPTVTAYILVAAILPPVLLTYGFDEATIHFFIMFYAVNASITPPVAPASLVAASMTGGDFFKTANRAAKLSVGLFIIPFMFIYNPALLGIVDGGISDIIVPFVCASIALISLSSAIQGFAIYRTFFLDRILLIAASILIVIGVAGLDNYYFEIIGFAVLAIGLFINYRNKRIKSA